MNSLGGDEFIQAILTQFNVRVMHIFALWSSWSSTFRHVRHVCQFTKSSVPQTP